MILQHNNLFLKRALDWLKKNTDKVAFACFLGTIAFSVRKVLIVQNQDHFNEFTSTTLFLSDIFLIITIISWLYKKEHNTRIMSIIQKLRNNIRNVPRGTFNFQRSIITLFIGLLLVTALFSENTFLAFVKLTRLIFYISLYFYVLDRFMLDHSCSACNSTEKRDSKKPIQPFFIILFFVAIVNIFIGLLQHQFGRSVGLFLFKESQISVNMPGVAKIIESGASSVRPYGFFPHPNVFAYFLYFCLYIGVIYLLERIMDEKRKCSTWNKLDKIEHEKRVWRISLTVGRVVILSQVLFLAILLLGIYSTHSRTIWIAVVIMLLYITGAFIKKYFYYSLITIFGIYSIISSLNQQSLFERNWYEVISVKMIQAHPIFGVGLGNFVSVMRRYADFSLDWWQLQPVHNVILLVFAESGLFSVITFCLFFLSLFHVEHFKNDTIVQMRNGGEIFLRKTHAEWLSLLANSYLLGVVFVLFFDHYIWDIIPAQGIFWLSLAIVQITKLTKL